MHIPIQITNESGIRTVGRIFNRHAFVLARLTISQIAVDVDMGVLVVREIVIDQRFAVDVFGAGDPFGKSLGNGAMVNPVHHVATLPRVVAAFVRLQSAGGVELIWKRSGYEWNVKSFKLGGFSHKRSGFAFLLTLLFPRARLAVTAKHPIVLRSFG